MAHKHELSLKTAFPGKEVGLRKEIYVESVEITKCLC